MTRSVVLLLITSLDSHNGQPRTEKQAAADEELQQKDKK